MIEFMKKHLLLLVMELNLFLNLIMLLLFGISLLEPYSLIVICIEIILTSGQFTLIAIIEYKDGYNTSVDTIIKKYYNRI